MNMNNNNALTLQDFGIIQHNNIHLTQVSANTFLSQGYTSIAGNTYFSAFRIFPDFIIKEEVGQGWCHTFLNGIKIYSRQKGILLAEGNFHCTIYTKATWIEKVTEVFLDAVKSAAIREKVQIDLAKIRNVFMNELQNYLQSGGNNMNLLE
ncbi:MAG: hypothetical protein OHK0038_28380 [Flammeovirgaceae bacterium]